MALAIQTAVPLLQVFDMPASVRFYRDVLGFAIAERSHLLSTQPDDFHWALLRRGSVELMLNTAYDEGQRPAMPEAKRVAAHDDTCLYFGCPDVDAAYRHLLEAGMQLKPPCVAPYGMKQLYLHDPDGYALCLQWQV